MQNDLFFNNLHNELGSESPKEKFCMEMKRFLIFSLFACKASYLCWFLVEEKKSQNCETTSLPSFTVYKLDCKTSATFLPWCNLVSFSKK